MPISFTCPHCGTQTSVAEQYAGQSGPCAACGKTVTIPALGPGGVTMAVPAKSSAGKTVAIVLGIVFGVLVLVCAGLALLLYPAVRSVRDQAQKMACGNNLRQIGLAMLHFESMQARLPAAYTTDKQGQPVQSWRVAILSQLDRPDLYDQYRRNRNEAWDSPSLQQVSRTPLNIYRCPGTRDAATIPASPTTNYFVVVGPNTAFPGKESRRTSDFTRYRGPSLTALVLEVEGLDVPWAQPKDLTLDDLDKLFGPKRDAKFKCPHKNAMNVAMADGSVRAVRLDADPEMVKRLFTINDGEPIDESKVFADR